MPNQKKPNILIIWGDDIGISNLSCYSHGLMGYQTPNIDRLAKEGMMFTDCYGEQSCTAGRSSFITGQSVYRTGLSKVGIPGAPVGMNDRIVTIAACLKNQNYATGPRLLDDRMLNVVLVMVLVTAILGPVLTEYFAPRLASGYGLSATKIL